MKKYIRVILGKGNKYSEQCYQNNFIGADYGITEDLTTELPENWRDFNAKYRDVWLQKNPGKSKISAGLACGMLWTICKGINKGDIVLSPDGKGAYYWGEIESAYYHQPGDILPHRRRIKWSEYQISKEDMSQELKNSSGSVGTTSDITKYSLELKTLIKNIEAANILVSRDETIESLSEFALEKHLEDFLVKNWSRTELGKDFDIYEEEGELVGQQYQSDTGPMDILAISKDKKTLLVVELKKGRASDNVVGQIQRYMGYVKEELSEYHQDVKGVIIGLEDDIRIKRALAVTSNIEFYRYIIDFKLFKS